MVFAFVKFLAIASAAQAADVTERDTLQIRTDLLKQRLLASRQLTEVSANVDQLSQDQGWGNRANERGVGIQKPTPGYLSKPGFPHCFSKEIRGDDRMYRTWCLLKQWPSDVAKCKKEHHEALLGDDDLGVTVCEAPAPVAVSPCEEETWWEFDCNSCTCEKGGFPVCTTVACRGDFDGDDNKLTGPSFKTAGTALVELAQLTVDHAHLIFEYLSYALVHLKDIGQGTARGIYVAVKTLIARFRGEESDEVQRRA